MRKVQLNTIEGLGHLKDYYFIQENGELYGYNGRKLRDTLNSHGYVENSLSTEGRQKNFKRHRLVALAFIPNPENKDQVNHIDEDKTNNDVSNLNWMTSEENNNHGTRTARTSKPVVGVCVKTGKQVEFPSTIEAGRQGFDNGSISKCCNGKQNTHKGFIWRFKE